jgi:hypothetical protein
MVIPAFYCVLLRVTAVYCALLREFNSAVKLLRFTVVYCPLLRGAVKLLRFTAVRQRCTSTPVRA